MKPSKLPSLPLVHVLTTSATVLVLGSLAACVRDIPVGPADRDAATDSRGTDARTGRDAGVDSRFVPSDVMMLPDGGNCGSGSDASDTMPITYWPTTSTTTGALPISGGTLAISNDQTTAIASDPDHNVVWLVDLATAQATSVALQPGDDPGRFAEDDENGQHRAHVVLRGGGAVLDIDLPTRTVIARRSVCAAPRGIAYDSQDHTLRVVCADGSLVSLLVSGGSMIASSVLGGDLRDVVFDPMANQLLVTRFRSAEILTVDPSTGMALHTAAPVRAPTMPHSFVPDVAWRMVPNQGGTGVVVLHQYAATDPICPSPGGYDSLQPIVMGATTAMPSDGVPATPFLLPQVATAVDVAISHRGEMTIAVAGAAPGNGMPKMLRFDASGNHVLTPAESSIVGQVIAVAYTDLGALVVQTRDPSMLYIDIDRADTPVMLGTALPHDTGHQIFHAGTGGGLSCAGCHPEGGDDGHVWNFAGLGQRRTQNLRGGILATAPFHWDGHFSNMDSLLDDVFHGRMSGPQLTIDQSAAVQRWVDTIPTIPHDAPLDPAAVARGEALFNDPNVGCNSCHSGPHFTNNSTVIVGTGGAFQVPSLVGVAFRAPYMHTGCATTLLDRFQNPCAGGDLHGHTSQLSDAQLGDLVAYLQSL